jgi:hypothetical protein
MYQTWSWLSFLQWSYEPRVLQRLLPNRLRPTPSTAGPGSA